MSPSEYQELVEFLTGQFIRVDRQFAAVEEQIRETRAQILGHFEEVYRRLERLEQEY